MQTVAAVREFRLTRALDSNSNATRHDQTGPWQAGRALHAHNRTRPQVSGDWRRLLARPEDPSLGGAALHLTLALHVYLAHPVR